MDRVLQALFPAPRRLIELIASVPSIVSIAGDAYMAASGHDGVVNHCHRLLDFACDMIISVSKMKWTWKEQSLVQTNSKHLEIRVGLHTGATYAGVVGSKCPR